MPPSCSPDAASRARLHRLLETTVLVALLAGLACPAWAQDGAASIRAERAALWHVAMAVPDGPDREFRFRDVRVHDDGALPGEGGPLICGALEFEDADAGIVRFALLYGRDGDGRLQAGTPFFYGRNWLLGTAELADRCATVGTAAEARPYPPR
ncbi:hypothetical protein GXW71_21705 [Roseomonas hellenica]|uniref:DUF2147 domain-containing protein n=1 Tax=Plastoroseomonas hellenica TaxID=2687306 RepID=A0ABS5F394_9PROT|nr:hypothetical protein [Plastoroseomonas hellenica]MBR0666991.1 hypothetical protein [Plastoroseomonas hellenica]